MMDFDPARTTLALAKIKHEDFIEITEAIKKKQENVWQNQLNPISVLYNPNDQNIGIAIKIDNAAGKKLKSLNIMNSSSLKTKASHVHKTHKITSVKITIVRFKYLWREII